MTLVAKSPPAQKKHGDGHSSLLSNSYVWIGLLAVIIVAIFSEFLFSDKMLFGSDTLGGLDARVLLRRSLIREFAYPGWLTTRLGGMPGMDALSFGDGLYPPTLLSLLVAPVHRALGLRLVLHVLLAGSFFYLMLRRGFDVPHFVSFVGAAFYMLNPQFFSHIYPGHDGKMFVIALLPLVVWRLKALCDRPNLMNSSLLALGVAACLFTSHIQMTYFVLWGVFLYWVMASVVLWRTQKTWGPTMRLAGYFWLAVFGGMGLAFIQLYPTFMFVRDAFSVRGVERGFDYAASWSIHWPEFFSLLVPEFAGANLADIQTYWSENPFKLNTEYAGAMAVLFGVLSIVQRPRPWRFFWGGIAVLAALYSLGAHTPVFHIAYALIPGVKKFRAGSMLMFWFSFSTILLASLSLKDVWSGRFGEFTDQQRRTWQKGLLVAMGVVTLGALLFSVRDVVVSLMQPLTESLQDARKSAVFEENFSKNFVPALWLWWLFAIACLGMLWGVIGGKIGTRVLVTTVLVIGMIDVIRTDVKFVKVVNPVPYFHTPLEIKNLQKEMEREPFRCFAFPGTFSHSDNGEGVHSLEGITGFHDNEMRWYREFRGDQQSSNFFLNLLGYAEDGKPFLRPEGLREGNAFINLANVKYYLLRQGDRILTIRNENDLGRISFVPGHIVKDSAEIVDALRKGTYDLRRTVALLQEPDTRPSGLSATNSAVRAQISWEHYSTNLRRARVTVPSDGFLRISEVYYPGWEVKIDGKPVKVHRADLAWMAVGIPAGGHVVEILPHSLYLRSALPVSLLFMGLALLYWVGSYVLKVRRRGSATTPLKNG